MKRIRIISGIILSLFLVCLGACESEEMVLDNLKQEINDNLGIYEDSDIRVSKEHGLIMVSSSINSSRNIDYYRYAQCVSAMAKVIPEVLDNNGETLGEISISAAKVTTDIDEMETISWTSSDGLTGNLHISKGTDIHDLQVKHDVSPDDLLKMYPEATPTPSPSPKPTTFPTPTPIPEPVSTPTPESTPIVESSPETASSDNEETAGTVYWTSGGEKYHSTSECVSLKRSKNIKHGTISQAGNREPCNLCF